MWMIVYYLSKVGSRRIKNEYLMSIVSIFDFKFQELCCVSVCWCWLDTTSFSPEYEMCPVFSRIDFLDNSYVQNHGHPFCQNHLRPKLTLCMNQKPLVESCGGCSMVGMVGTIGNVGYGLEHLPHL